MVSLPPEQEHPLLHWLLEEIVSVGGVKLGFPGMVTLAMYLTPMVEVVPTLLREQSVQRLPLLPYSSMVCAGLVWGTYGSFKGIATVATINFISMVLGGYYCWVFCRFCPSDADWLPGNRRIHFAGILSSAAFCLVSVTLLREHAELLLAVTGNVMYAILVGSPLSVVRTVLSEKSTESLPFGYSCLVTFNSGLWVAYAGLVLQNPVIVLPNLVGFLLGLAQLSLFWWFGFSRRPADGRGPPKQVPSSPKELVEATQIGAPEFGTASEAEELQDVGEEDPLLVST